MIAVDIWAAGCVLGELLLGDPLVGGENEMDQIHKVSTHIAIIRVNTIAHSSAVQHIPVQYSTWNKFDMGYKW